MRSQFKANSFSSSIFPYSLKFKNEDIEKRYMEKRMKNTIIFKIVYLTTIIIWWTYGIRNLQVYCQLNFVANPVKRPSLIFLLSSILCFISIILEMILLRFNKLKKFKGFIFTIPTVITFLYSAYEANIFLSNIMLFYPPNFVALFICFISMAFVYCFNWICGLLLIFKVLLAVEICL